MSIPETAKVNKITVFAGGKLKDRREAAGLTPEALGRLVDVTDETIRLWESGRATPSGSKIARLVSVLDCEPNDLFLTLQLTE